MSAATVLFLSNSGDLAGGGELSLHDLVLALPLARLRPVVVCPGPGALEARLRDRGIVVERVEFPAWRRPRPGATPRALARLAGLVRAHRPALMHCNATWRIALYAGLVARWTRVPLIWHVRVADSDRWKDRLLARLATRIVANSDAVARRFAWAPPGRVVRIYNGIDPDRFAPRPPSPADRAALGLPPRAPVVGSIGRFVPEKGYVHLLQAARRVRDEAPETHWVLVGDGELRGSLEESARRFGLAGVVHFAGWQTRVAEYLALFDLFVLPSLGEHFGRVLVEAMAMEKAVIATDGGGVPEIVRDGETGILVPSGDAGALAAAVLSLLKDPARAARLGAAGRRRVIAQFTLARHVAAVEALYQSLIGGPDARLAARGAAAPSA